MDTKTIIWIVVAVVALIVLGIVLWGGRRRELTHRHAQAEEMREQLRHEDAEVRAHADSLDGGGSGHSAQKSGPRTQQDG